MRARLRQRSLSLLFLALVCCVEPFESPVDPNDATFLTVDGFVNLSTHTATVKVRRSVQLEDARRTPPVTNASVIIASDGKEWRLAETKLGDYVAQVHPASDELLTLRIVTTDGKRYESEPISLQSTPPITSVTWEPDETGLGIYVNSQDDEGKSKYYLWTSAETWEYVSPLPSYFLFNNGDPIPRPPDQQIQKCWKTVESTKIMVWSTSGLEHVVIEKFPIMYIPKASVKLYRRYSILVRQQSISEQGYNFFQQLQRSTENLGGLFDPLPSEVIGNIRSEQGEPVLGFFSASAVAEKRIFIDFRELPDHLLRFSPPNPECEISQISVREIASQPKNTLLIGTYGSPVVQGYLTARAD